MKIFRLGILTYARLVFAFTMAVAAFGSDQADLAHAYELQRQGSLKKARAIYESTISHLRSGADSAALADALRRLSEIDLAEGKYSKAMQQASECAALSHTIHLPAIEIDCLSVKGRAQIYSGDYPAGLATHQQALRVASLGNAVEDRIALLNNIGAIYFFLGHYAECHDAYLQAQSLLRGHENQSWYARRQQLTLANLAALYQQLGQHQRALDVYSQIRAISAAMRPSEQAVLLVNMGTLYRRLGDPIKALESYRQAQHLFATGRNRDGEIGVIRNSGIALALDLGDLNKALNQFNTALHMATESGSRLQSVQAHLYLGETFWRLGQLDSASQHFAAALSGARNMKSTEDQWKAEYGLGRLFEKSGDSRRALEHYQSAIAAIESIRSPLGAAGLQAGFLADKRDVYDSLIALLLAAPNPQPNQVLSAIEKAKARTFQDRINQGSPGPVISSIAARLDPGTLVLDFWIGQGKAAAFWMTRNGSGIARLQAPSPAELDSFGKELANGSGASWRAAASTISDQLLTPVALQLAAANQVIIVADGLLQKIPFETLPAPGSLHSALLLETFPVSYVPSISAIKTGLASSKRTWLPPWRTELIAFANPTIQTSQPNSLLPTRLTSLPASTEEVQSIAALLGGRSEIHSGSDDKKRYLERSRLRGVAFLHLSTHAIADTDDADRSRIVFSPESNGQSAEFLFSREISGLDLNGLRLATLAACDTEGGRAIAGEGVQSFSRAFLEAGAASVITALWRIGDQSTAQFMKVFYARLANGDAASEALREAKLAFYRSNSRASHPRYWAAFVLNGDGRTDAPRPISWVAVLAVALLFSALAYTFSKSRIQR